MDRGSVQTVVTSLARADVESLSDGGLVDLLRRAEELKAAAAGLQARATAALRTRELGRRGEAAESSTARSVGGQVGLARRESPHRGRELVSFAAMLVADLPYTLEALTFGHISERRAMILAAEVADLDPTQRWMVDERLLGNPAGCDGLGDVALRHQVRREVYRIDTDSVLRRREKAKKSRTVSCRRGWAGGDGMAGISGWVEDTAAAAIMTSLSEATARVMARQADDPDDGRSRTQVMADLFVSRLTGQPTAAATPVAVKLVVSAEALLGDDDTPAQVEHLGPVPAAVARRLVGASPEVGSTIQQLFRFPGTGTLVAMASTARTFTGRLRAFIGIRDGWAGPAFVSPGLDPRSRPRKLARALARPAPRHARSFLAAVAACWRHRTVTGDGDPRPHEIETTAPTGHTYRSRSPALPPEPRAPDRPTYTPRLELHWAGCPHAA